MIDSLQVSDSTVWHIGTISRVAFPLNTTETLTLLYVIVTALIFVGTIAALIFTSRNLKEVVAARGQQARAVFENTFFHLVNLHHEIVRGIWVIETDWVKKNPPPKYPGVEGEFDAVEHRIEGRAAFITMYERLAHAYEERKSENPAEPESERVAAAYEKFYKQHSNRLGHYFRNLYNTVKYVDRAAPNDKQLYLNILRAQLSSIEMVLLFYNCLTNHGRPKFKALIEKYTLLERIPMDELIDRGQHEGLYEHGAFEDSTVNDE